MSLVMMCSLIHTTQYKYVILLTHIWAVLTLEWYNFFIFFNLRGYLMTKSGCQFAD